MRIIHGYSIPPEFIHTEPEDYRDLMESLGRYFKDLISVTSISNKEKQILVLKIISRSDVMD